MDAEGAKTVFLRWVDTDRSHADRPNYRSRLVEGEIKKAKKRSHVPSGAKLFSGMPPLESVKKSVVSLFVSHYQEEAKGERTLAMYDISRAHIHGVPVRRVFVELPDDEKERLARENGPDGTVDASALWQAHYAQILKGHSFVHGLSNPALFVHVERDIRLLVHGDGFMVEDAHS